MGTNDSFEFKPSRLVANLKHFDGDLNALVAATVDFRADKAITYMKTNAKWTDRTGNARATLNAEPEHSDTSHLIRLFGGMPYQIWLEICFAGRLAIITPAVRYQGLALMNQLRGLVNKLQRRGS
jgi:hypothetical protein